MFSFDKGRVILFIVSSEELVSYHPAATEGEQGEGESCQSKDMWITNGGNSVRT